ncbi:MAG: sigma-70 family RNA polymerase sigma factor, partial [Deltaproteobacteria bacterium]|nr:sigma-70 family RNA polymerase sigma factor [Deltaproteobacteria bacterium]
ELLERVALDHRDAKLELVRRIRDRVRRKVYFLTPFADEREDLIQEVICQILLSAGRYRGEGTLESWVDAVTMRTTRKAFGRTCRRRRVFVPSEPDLTMSDADVEAEALERARTECLAALLRKLPADQAIVLVHKLAHGWSLEEISRGMGLKVATVRYLLRKGRASLKKEAVRNRIARELFSGGSR